MSVVEKVVYVLKMARASLEDEDKWKKFGAGSTSEPGDQQCLYETTRLSCYACANKMGVDPVRLFFAARRVLFNALPEWAKQDGDAPNAEKIAICRFNDSPETSHADMLVFFDRVTRDLADLLSQTRDLMAMERTLR